MLGPTGMSSQACKAGVRSFPNPSVWGKEWGPARLSQGLGPLHGMAWRGKQDLQLHPCPCPAITPRIGVTPLGVTFLLPSHGQEFDKHFLEKAASLPHCASLTLLVLDIYRFNEQARGGVGSPLSPMPGRRAGAHVSPAICKSTDIIRAVVEGITGASAGKKPRSPAWGGGWVVLLEGSAFGPHPRTPPGHGTALGQCEGLCAAVPCAGEAAQNWDLLPEPRICPHFRAIFHRARVKQCSATSSACSWSCPFAGAWHSATYTRDTP